MPRRSDKNQNEAAIFISHGITTTWYQFASGMLIRCQNSLSEECLRTNVFVCGEKASNQVGVEASQSKDGPDSEEANEHFYYREWSVLQRFHERCVLGSCNSKTFHWHFYEQ